MSDFVGRYCLPPPTSHAGRSEQMGGTGRGREGERGGGRESEDCSEASASDKRQDAKAAVSLVILWLNKSDRWSKLLTYCKTWWTQIRKVASEISKSPEILYP